MALGGAFGLGLRIRPGIVLSAGAPASPTKRTLVGGGDRTIVGGGDRTIVTP